MAWAHVQSKPVDAGSVTSVGLAYTSAVTAGNMLIAIARTGSGVQPSGIADSLGQVFTKDKAQIQTTDNAYLTAWRYFVTAAGANTVTLTNPSAVTTRFIILEYSHLRTIAPDGSNSAQADASVSLNTGNVTTTLADVLLLCAAGTSTVTAVTPDAAFTVRQDIPASPLTRLHVSDRVVTATGTYSATTTFAPNNAMTLLMAYGESVESSAAARGLAASGGMIGHSWK